MKGVPETRPPLEQVHYSHGKFMQRAQHGQNPSVASATKCADSVPTTNRAES